jgi:hypothetical protein
LGRTVWGQIVCPFLLLAGTPDDAEYQARQAAFLQALQQLGWSGGRNVLIDTRWAAGDPILFANMRPN